MAEGTWRRALSPEEARFIEHRYEVLSARWRQRFPDVEPPPCGGDALERIRTVQLMLDKLRRGGVSQEEIIGLVRGPGMVVEDAALRAAQAQAATPAPPAPEPETNGDPGVR